MYLCKNLDFNLYFLLYFFSFGVLSNFPAFPAEVSQFQTPFMIQRGALLVKTNDNEESSYYLLDTGISIPIMKNMEDGSKLMVKDFEYTIPFIPAYQGKVILSDLKDVSRRIGIPIIGILPVYYPGYEIYLDFGKGKVVWQLISAQKKVKTKDMFCEKIYFSLENTMPKVAITLNDKIAVTGNIDFVRGESIILPMSLVNERNLLTGESRFVHFQNKKVIQYFRLNTLKLGNQKFNNLLAISVPGEKEISLGTSFWRQFVIRLNYEEASICFLKSNISTEHEWAGVGILLDCFAEQGWIVGVIENSSAWENGLRGGETLVKINEWDVKDLNSNQIIQLLNPPPGRQVVCEVVDISKTLKVLNLLSKKII